MTRRVRHARILVLVVAVASGCAVAPRQPVLPYPDHIIAAITVGDRVEVTTQSGELRRFTVTGITARGLVADDMTVNFDDIRSIAMRSFKSPRNPCDDERPLDCSVPRIARLTSEFHDRFADYFRPSCRLHDYCYRYGTKTYGFDRGNCDSAFLDAMQAQCTGKLDLNLVWRAECLAAARHFHSAVVEHGAASFLGENGETCEYSGPPTNDR